MVKHPEVLAIIPARGGSKSIPKKNIQPFVGHPLVAYSIAAGLQAEFVDRVIVSTDDPEIGEIARGYGAETPFLRPESLAQDDTPDLPVFEHALSWLAIEQGYHPEIVVQLRPTSPIRPPDCVDKAISILLQNMAADSVRGIVPSGQNPYKMWRIGPSGKMHPLLETDFEEPFNMPRQKLPATYWQTGHIDAIRSRTILELNSMSGKDIFPLLLDPRYTVDIDTWADWRRAEWLVIQSDLEMVWPGGRKRKLPSSIHLLVMDFDGVLTDDRVWVDESGSEMVAANRSDGFGLARLRQMGIPALVISKERNPVVTARCRKMEVECIQSVDLKVEVLTEYLEEKGIPPGNVIFVGNDLNDLPCFPKIGFAVAVADANPARRGIGRDRRGR